MSNISQEAYDSYVGDDGPRIEKFFIVDKRDGFYRLNIYINGLLHISLPKADLMGIESWIDWGQSQYKIAFILRNHEQIVTEYDNRYKWSEVLKALDKVFPV